MKKVLFFAPFGQFGVHHQLDALLAAALRKRGCEVFAVTCDGIFSTCDVLTWSGDRAAQVCTECAACSKRLFARFQLPLAQLRSYLTPHDFERVRQWSIGLDVTTYTRAEFDGQPVGEWAISSVFSHFRITSASLHRPEVRLVHRGYLVTAALTWIALSRLVKEQPVDAMVIFNSRMATYRVAYEVARANGLRVLSHERGTTPNSFSLYEDCACTDPQSVFRFVDQRRQVPLSPEEITQGSAMMHRQGGVNMNWPGYYHFRTGAEETARLLGIPPGARILGVFTSSEFELANNSYYKSVTQQLEYVARLIEVFRQRPNDWLVVRHHPNIVGDANVCADHDFLRRAWAQAMSAPPNVRIIMPAEKLSSYGLLPHLSGAISFFSTVGLEAIAHGVAAATLSEAYCHPGATFIISDTSQQGFSDLVDRLFARTLVFQPQDFRSSYRHLTASLARHSSTFQALGIKDYFTPELKLQDESELLPGHDPLLDRTCEFLMGGGSVFDMPTEADKGRSTADEDAFFQTEWQHWCQERQQCAPAEAPPPDATADLAVAVVSPLEELPAWARASRHARLVHHRVDAGRIEELKRVVSELTEPYVLIAAPEFEYDTSFVRSALQTLEKGTTLAGIRAGAWVARPDGTIEGEVFTPRFPSADYQAACASLPTLHRPEVVLGFALWRTSRLAEVLKAMPSTTADAGAEHLFGVLRGESVQELLAPMIMALLPELPADRPVAPVLFLIFNRPDLTQMVFESIRAEKPRQLFIAADGPRPHVQGERELCEATRRFVLDHIDWECEVKTLFRAENLGCKHAVAGAIRWFFEQVPEGIILEDDCLPEPDFFRFCTEMLHRHRDDRQVAMIGGVNFQQGRQRGAASYYFSKYTHIWGWASWRRAWQHYKLSMDGLDEFLASASWQALCPQEAERAYWQPVFTRVRDGLVDTWDYQWTYTVWRNDGLVILPQVNLVTNLGFRADATHTTQSAGWLASLKTRSLGTWRYADRIERAVEADDFTFEQVFQPPKPKAKSSGSKSKAKKTAKNEARQARELDTMKRSLAWRLVGKPFYSIEKRLRRLFGSARD